MHNAKKLLESDDSDIPLGLMVSMIYRTRLMFINEKIKNMDITAGQIPFLMELSHEEGISQDDLASHFHIDKGTVARALRKLEDNDYLYRKTDPNNRRRYIIYLTEKGKATVPQIIKINKEWESSIRSKISKTEYNHLFNALKTMALSCINTVNTEKDK